jgi:hypothetical protein
MGQARERRRQAGEVRVAVTKVARSHDVMTTEVRLEAGEWPFDPIAPATVWTDDDRRVVDLHRLVRMDGDEATFESYDLTGETPQPGGPYRIVSWWDPPNSGRRRTETCDGIAGHTTNRAITRTVCSHGRRSTMVRRRTRWTTPGGSLSMLMRNTSATMH